MSEEMEQKLARKRESMAGGGKSLKTLKNFAVMALTLGITVVSAYVFFGTAPADPPSRFTGGAGIALAKPSEPGEVSHPVSSLETDRAGFFDYTTADGVKMRYFLIKTKDGVVRSAFDACDSCWPAGKGYKQDGDVMICNNCRMRFPLEKIGEVKGGCNPSPLVTRVVGDRVLIATSDIENGKRYFDLKK